ncbi:MAG TPA: hypothetical protein VFX17_00090 [Patescibacteria group bacterium]|nr:hypothetical protein [Patescibacteria group bacterium]
MAYKLVVIVAVCWLTWFMVRTVLAGRVLATVFYDEDRLALHRDSARLCLWLTFGLVALIEFGVRWHSKANYGLMFEIHLCFALPFLALLVVLNRFATGLKSANHGLLAYLCLAMFAGMLVTGTVLLYRL